MVRPPWSEPASISRCVSPSSSESRQPTSLDESASRRSLTTLAGMPKSTPNGSRPSSASRPNSAKRRVSSALPVNVLEHIDHALESRHAQPNVLEHIDHALESRHAQPNVENNFDYFGVEAVRMSLQAFDKATDLGDVNREAYNMGKRFGASKECKLLIGAGERLVHAVGTAIHGDLKVIRRLPKAIAHKALELCCSGLLPDLNELQHLRRRVQSLQQEHLASSRTYLDEIVFWRSRARIGEEVISFKATDHYLWDPMKALPEEVQSLATDIIIEKLKCYVSQDHGKTLNEIQDHLRKLRERIAESGQQLDEVRQELADANGAKAELVSRLQLQVSKLTEMEKEHLDAQETAQRCVQVENMLRIEHRKNKELHTEVEELRDLLSASHAAKLERELCDSRKQNAALEARAFAAEKVIKERDLSSFNLPDVLGATAEETLQRHMSSLGEHLSFVTGEKRFEDWLYRISVKLQTEITSLKDSYDAERVAKEEVERRLNDALEELDDYHCTYNDPDEDIGFGQAEPVPTPSMSSLAARRDLPGLLACAVNGIESSSILGRRTSARTTVSSPDSPGLSAGQLSNPLSPRRQSRVSVLKQRHEMDMQELAEVTERLKEKEQELEHCRLFAVKAEKLEVELSNLRNLQAKTKAELCEARDSHLHPAVVAQLKLELQQAKHEWFAADNIKKALQTSLHYMQTKFSENVEMPHHDPIMEDLSFIVEASDRNVYSRLYEDALRRRYQFSNIWESMSLLQPSAEREDVANNDEEDQAPNQSLLHRSFSAPSRVLLSGDVYDLLKRNALHLVAMRAEPLFPKPVKLPPNKDKKPQAHRPVPLEPCANSSVPPDKKNTETNSADSAYEEQERVGSLVVWRRASTPGSQSSTTASNSPSPNLGLISPPSSRPESARTNSRPGSALKTPLPRPRSAQTPQCVEAPPRNPPRPSSAPRVCGFPRVVKNLPCKLLSKEAEGQAKSFTQSPGCSSALQTLPASVRTAPLLPQRGKAP